MLMLTKSVLMEQGLKLIVQWVIEFAPLIAVLLQKQDEEAIVKFKNLKALDIQDLLQNVKGIVETKNSPSSFEQEKALQQQLADYHRETQLKLAAYQRETTLKSPEIHKIIENWPLRLYPSQILESHPNSGLLPLRIFLKPPQLQPEQFGNEMPENLEIEMRLAEGMREFLNHHYSLHNQVRPTEFLAGAWENKQFHGEASIKALFGMIKSEPTLILESEIDGNNLIFRMAYWGLNQDNYYYKSIAKLPYREILYESAKARALGWKEIREKLLALGEPIDEVNKLGGDNAINLEILEKQEKWKAHGIDASQLSLPYKVKREDFATLWHFLINCHCLVASWVTDTYHLVHHDVPPLLPKLLPNLMQDVTDLQLIQAIVSGYRQVYQALAEERRYWVPELALQLAQSLMHLPDKSWSKEQVEYSVNSWLQIHQVTPAEGSDRLEAMKSALKIEDYEYIEQLKEYFVAIGDDESVGKVQELLNAIADLKRKYSLEHISPIYNLTEQSGKVSSVAISADGKILVSSCLDKTIKVWDLQTGELIRTLTGNTEKVTSVAISPNGQFVASGSYDSPGSNVKVWNLRTGKLLPIIFGHNNPVKFVAIDSKGQVVFSGSNKIKLWNLQTGERLCTLWHSCGVNCAAMSKDGQIIASGQSDGKIRIWHPQSGEPRRTISGHSGEVYAVVITPDEQTLISGGADKAIKLWHLGTGELLGNLEGHSEAVSSLAISADGKTLVSGSADKTIKVWHLDTGKLRGTLTAHSAAVNSIALSADGKILASGSADKTIKVWQLY